MSTPPSSVRVAVKWLQGIQIYGNRVATTLPQDLSDWADNGFVTVEDIGGVPHPYLSQERPVVSVHFWAVALNKSRPPWGQAYDLYSYARYSANGVIDYRNIARRLTGFGTDYQGIPYSDAQVNMINFVGAPERRPGDPGDFAEIIANLELAWVPL